MIRNGKIILVLIAVLIFQSFIVTKPKALKPEALTYKILNANKRNIFRCLNINYKWKKNKSNEKLNKKINSNFKQKRQLNEIVYLI